MWTEYYVVILLLWNAAADLRRQEISLPALGIFAAGGLAANLLLKYQSVPELLAGLAVGVFVLAASAVTRGAIGFGDGLVLCVTGIFLGGRANLQLLMSGLILCALILGAGLLAGRMERKQRVPFIPFLCAAQLGRILL